MVLVQRVAGSALDTHWSGSSLVTRVTCVLNVVTESCVVGKTTEHSQDYRRTFPGEGRKVKEEVAHFSQTLAFVLKGRDRHPRGCAGEGLGL